MICAVDFYKLPIYAQILIPSAILFVLGSLFALLLAFLFEKFKVTDDDRVKRVREKLSGANCGGCGYPGCDGFAEALVEGEAKLSDCSATSKENKKFIAELLGTKSEEDEIAFVVKCNGGVKCTDKYQYQGYGDCKSMELLAGGKKSCPIGCMVAGSCTYICSRSAAEIDNTEGISRINQSKCVGCGVCAKECPKSLIQPIPKNAKYYVACMSHESGKIKRTYCKGACIGCGVCARVCKEDAISVKDGLAVIDYNKCISCGECYNKCPANCIKQK